MKFWLYLMVLFIKSLLAKRGIFATFTAPKMKFSIKDFFSNCDQIRSFLRIWSQLLKKSLMENFIFGAVFYLFVARYHTPIHHVFVARKKGILNHSYQGGLNKYFLYRTSLFLLKGLCKYYNPHHNLNRIKN